MDLSLPPMPFSAVFVPVEGAAHLHVPEEMRNSSAYGAIALPPGVVQVIVTWKGRDRITVRHYVDGHGYETAHIIPASSSVGMRSSGVLTISSDVGHQIQVVHGSGTGSAWEPGTLAEGYVVGVQVMPMGTAADITGGGSMLRVDDSVGTRVFLGDTMIHGDTGWRSIPLMENFAGVCRIRRMGSIVEARLEDVHKIDTNIAGTNVVSLPVGWRLTNPATLPSTYRVPFVINNSGRSDEYAYIAANGVYLRVTDNSGNPGNTVFNFTVDQGWPTSLPGTPA